MIVFADISRVFDRISDNKQNNNASFCSCGSCRFPFRGTGQNLIRAGFKAPSGGSPGQTIRLILWRGRYMGDIDVFSRLYADPPERVSGHSEWQGAWRVNGADNALALFRPYLRWVQKVIGLFVNQRSYLPSHVPQIHVGRDCYGYQQRHLSPAMMSLTHDVVPHGARDVRDPRAGFSRLPRRQRTACPTTPGFLPWGYRLR